MSTQMAKLCYRLFRGRRDTFAIQKRSGPEVISYFRVEREVTEAEYQAHLLGKEVMGIYPLLPSGKLCYCAAMDIDSPDLELTKQVADMVPKPNYIERSRSGNYHIWMFFNKPVPVHILESHCREGIDFARASGEHHCNLYPLPAKGLGLLIALPLQPALARRGLTAFLDDKGKPLSLEDHYQFLKELKYTKLRKSVLDEPKVQDLWLGQGKTTGDQTKSGYDFSFARLLFTKGLPEEDVRYYLLQRPDLHSTDEDYIKRTLKAAAKKGKPKEETPVEVCDWEGIKPLNRKEFYELLGTKLILHQEQMQHFDLFFASLIANLKTRGRPVWILFIGPPGGGKTLPMMAIRHSPFVYSASSFRPAALISGWGLKGGADMSLIPKLDGKILLVKDMSSLLSQNKDAVAEVMGLLRDAYDGACSRPFGTGVERSYTSRFGFIGATTPDIDIHWGLNVRLGERFLRYRVRATLDQVYAKIDRSLELLSGETEFDSVVEEACMGFLKYLTRADAPLPRLSDYKQVGRLAQLGEILRTAVARGQYTQHVLVMPTWGEATRYAKQLAKTAMALAFVRGKESTDLEEFNDLKALVRDSMDARMEKICRTISKAPGSDLNDIAASMCLPAWTARSCLDDLATARILIPNRAGFKTTWSFVPWIGGQLQQFKLWANESPKE